MASRCCRRGKPKVEVGVQVVERWVLARLRNQRFFSLAELDRAIGRAPVECPARRAHHGGRAHAGVAPRALPRRVFIDSADKYEKQNETDVIPRGWKQKPPGGSVRQNNMSIEGK
jgi:hypothetical protein